MNARIEGYAIVSDNGMIATANGTMPRALKFDADQDFFERGLNSVDVVVHGRHSRERHRRSDMRRRLILTRGIPSIASDANNRNALFWNPTGATLEEALVVLGAPNGSIGVIGGTDVFGLFLDPVRLRYTPPNPSGRKFIFISSIEKRATASSTRKSIRTPDARSIRKTSLRPTKRAKVNIFPSNRTNWKR
jgi:dihydrofolate reductase